MYSMHIYYKEYLSHIHMQPPLDLWCLQLMFSYYIITQESIQFSNHLALPLSLSLLPSFLLFYLPSHLVAHLSSLPIHMSPFLVQFRLQSQHCCKASKTTKCATKYLYNVINYAQMLLNVKQKNKKQNTKAFKFKFRALTINETSAAGTNGPKRNSRIVHR